VHANGVGCARFEVGERVACLTVYDGQAELANVPEAFVVAVLNRSIHNRRLR